MPRGFSLVSGLNAVLEFRKRYHGRKLREVMDAEIDISDVIH
jgi:hypothetical protein